MELEIILNLEKDQKLHDYLLNHSTWYRLLNRDKSYFNDLKKAYKAYKHDNNMNKINETIDNIDLITNVIKMTNN